MAERRMFAKTIIDSDAFLEMPQSTQLLYFHLSMRADDDGFINKPRSILKIVGCGEDDIKLLIMKKFVIPFDSGIVVIKHWRIHNYIRKDTYHETKYKVEKSTLLLDENGSYTSSRDEPVTNPSTQVRLGKDSIINNNNNIGNNFQVEEYFTGDTDNLILALKDFIHMRKTMKKPMTDRAVKLLLSELKKLSNGDNDTAVLILNQSIIHSWQSVYALKDQPKPVKSVKVSEEETDFYSVEE